MQNTIWHGLIYRAPQVALSFKRMSEAKDANNLQQWHDALPCAAEPCPSWPTKSSKWPSCRGRALTSNPIPHPQLTSPFPWNSLDFGGPHGIDPSGPGFGCRLIVRRQSPGLVAGLEADLNIPNLPPDTWSPKLVTCKPVLALASAFTQSHGQSQDPWHKVPKQQSLLPTALRIAHAYQRGLQRRFGRAMSCLM